MREEQSSLMDRHIVGCTRSVQLYPGKVHSETGKKGVQPASGLDASEDVLWQALCGLTNAREREKLVCKLRDIRLKHFAEGKQKKGGVCEEDESEDEDDKIKDHPGLLAEIPGLDKEDIEKHADKVCEEEFGDQPEPEGSAVEAPAGDIVEPEVEEIAPDGGEVVEPEGGEHAAEEIAEVVDGPEIVDTAFDWGAFHFTPKGEGDGKSWQVQCPFHRKTASTGCKKTLSISTRGGCEATALLALKYWAVQALNHKKQVRHMHCFDVAKVKLPPVHEVEEAMIPAELKPVAHAVLVDADIPSSDGEAPEGAVPVARGRGARGRGARGRGRGRAALGPARGRARGHGGGALEAAEHSEESEDGSSERSSSSSSSSSSNLSIP